MKPNGPAIKGGCVTRRRIRAESPYFSHVAVTPKALTESKTSVMGCKEGMAHFLLSGYKFY